MTHHRKLVVLRCLPHSARGLVDASLPPALCLHTFDSLRPSAPSARKDPCRSGNARHSSRLPPLSLLPPSSVSTSISVEDSVLIQGLPLPLLPSTSTAPSFS